MELLTKELLDRLPPPHSQEAKGEDATIHAKFFSPTSSWTWYATEFDRDERVFFGLVDGFVREWGYFSLDELESVKGPLGLGVERDRYWTPMTIRELMAKNGWSTPWS